MVKKSLVVLCCFAFFANSAVSGSDPLPNTKPLTETGDLARLMVDGIHKYLDRELATAAAKRDELWKAEIASKEQLAKSLPAKREHLRKMLGIVDERVKPKLEFVSGPGKPSLLAEIDGCKIHTVRWAVLPGVDAEGLLIEPKEKPRAFVVAVPHADQSPEEVAGLSKGDQFGLRLAFRGCRVLIPTLIDRADEWSGNAKLNRFTNLPHREFLSRMLYEMGRTLTGMEVQKVLASVDSFAAARGNIPIPPIGVIGYGDGGMIALVAGALDDRIAVTQTSGYFNELANLWKEPIDRNTWGFLREFGDAELAYMIHPRNFIAEYTMDGPKWTGPVTGKAARGGAAPGELRSIGSGGGYEEARLRNFLTPGSVGPAVKITFVVSDFVPLDSFQELLGINERAAQFGTVPSTYSIASARQKRQFDQLVAYTQKLWRDSEVVRKDFWKKTDASSPEKWEQSCEWYRNYFWEEVIGKLPEPTVPMNPRSRQVYDEPTWAGYEVMIDVFPDVFSQGVLLLPKGMKPNEKRPVVVCQHGLEGTPQKCIDIEKGPTYDQFARKLVEKGYIVYCPQNPYKFENHFRQIQRKANPLKLSLFSFIIAQHRRTIDWLETLPNVDPKRIAFYGLSYGGKTAMRVPAVEKRYCLSICSGDFNEWVGKCVSVDLDRSYMWTREYDMYEFDLGNTFNYAEMAYLIAPRPFMVERGHDDPVGTDEMVAYEYAKVRYLYANKLKIPDRTAIEFFPGGHRINGKGTFDFLEKHLGKP
jgi:dienelactone hydrolase